jgi:ligand-binding sensor domain-containing protein/serine phosphatase RsbU (regulator of sigma subunit)
MCAFLCMLVLSNICGQSYRYRNYGSVNGLTDTYIYTINQDNNGFIWIGTGTGLTRFDGINFQNIIFPDSVSNRYVNASLKDKNGILWFGCNDGTLFYLKNNNLIKLQDQNIQSINSLLESPDGYIWVIPQDKMILKINENNFTQITKLYLASNVQKASTSLILWSSGLAPGGKLLLGTQENMLYCAVNGDSIQLESIISGIEYAKVSAIQPLKDEGKFLIGVEGNGLFRLKISNLKPLLTRFPDHIDLESGEVKSIFRDQSGSCWVSTNGTLFKLDLSENEESIESETIFNKNSGLPGDNFKTVFQDLEGNFWIGFYGEGLSVLPSQAFSFYNPSEKPENKSIIYINSLNEKSLLGTPEGYFLFNLKTGKPEIYNNLKTQIQQNEIISFLLDKSNRLWIGTKGGGLFLNNLRGETRLIYRSGNNSEDNIYHLANDGKYLWLSTPGGLIIIDPETGNVKKKFKTEDRLPHNSINEILIKKDKNALIATECDRLYQITEVWDVIIGKGLMKGNYKNKILCFTESIDGKIWAGTSGNGLFCFTGDSVTRYTLENGLLNNYCYSVFADSENKIWIGHERGFSRLDVPTGIIKSYLNDFARTGLTSVTDLTGGGNCNPHAIYETKDGKVLIGTTEGLICFDPGKERTNTRPPINNILQVTINETKYQYKNLYTLPFKKRNKVVIDYVGIALSNPEKVSYQLKMDNFDDNWSGETYSRQGIYYLNQGRYKFNLMSVNEDGITQETPLTFDILIKKPAWQTWWFFLLSLAALSGIVTLIIYFREKSQREMKEYLENELAERTREVLKQKDEIELQNIEITDSINYAKRIQSSILPDVNRLKDTFRDAFIIFHPRDIVSGDFYWFDRIDDEKFIIVCADSTGHGVPGAFMSMIGSTLLQDIIARKGVTRPSEILTLLDKQIFSTLNQNMDVGVSNDGMDMVVCEFNTKTRHLRFASAMRPVIIVLGGESYYIRGNRCSVGGESVVEKYFDDQEYYLANEDTIYMFSDGLPDQFGGPDGKKMKIARLKKLIEEICSLPMIKQKEIISDFFFDWKGDYEQVDDILLIGIKI